MRKSKFKIQWWKWYLVDLRNWHKPIIVRKHLDSKEQAEDYRKRYFNKDFDIIFGKEVMKFELKDGRDLGPKHRHKTRTATKYYFPPHVVTQLDRKKFRYHIQRKRRKMKNLPELRGKDIYNILEDKPIRFCRRVSMLKANYWAYSEPSPGLDYFIKNYKWPYLVNYLIRIEKTLIEFKYDCGIWPTFLVAEGIHKIFDDLIMKLSTERISRNINKVEKEFLARGFVPYSPRKYDITNHNWVMTVNLNQRLIYPENAWFDNGDRVKPGMQQIYNLQGYLGIPGYTKASIKKLAK